MNNNVKEYDVLPTVSMLSEKTDSHEKQWIQTRTYYETYATFLDIMYKKLRRVSVQAFDNALDTLSDSLKIIGALMASYIDDDVTNRKLADLWQRSAQSYKEMRTVMMTLSPDGLFNTYERWFVQGARFMRFMARRTASPGLPVIQSQLRDQIQTHRQLYATHYSVDAPPPTNEQQAEVNRVGEWIGIRIDYYESQEDVRAAYSALARYPMGKSAEAVEALLSKLYALGSGPLLASRLAQRNLLLQLRNAVVSLIRLPVIMWRRGRLVFVDNDRPVTALAALRTLDDESRVTTAQTSFQAEQYISRSRRLIEALPSDVDMEALLQSNLQRLFMTSEFTASVFAPFRGKRGNCRVEHVRIERQDLDVLVANRAIRQGERLYRDYSDSELYKIWEAYHDTALRQRSTTQEQQTLRQYISTLQLQRIRLMTNGERGELARTEATDYKIRIHVLSELLSL